jgi:hypothetical protein
MLPLLLTLRIRQENFMTSRLTRRRGAAVACLGLLATSMQAADLSNQPIRLALCEMVNLQMGH